MSLTVWLSTRWWILVVGVSILLAGWAHALRIGHVEHVSNLAGGSEIAVDSDSPTGYEGGMRRLIIPVRSFESFQWIVQVDSMFATDTWRLREVDYDNAPDGRRVRTASAYRWWLAGIAWVDHSVLGTPMGLSVERAALVADPLVQLLMVLVTSILLARYFSGWSAALFSLGSVAIFPLGGAFAPGQPGESTLLLACSLWSVLFIAGGIQSLNTGGQGSSLGTSRRRFLLSGLFGGVGMWIGISGGLPVVVGIALSGAALSFYFSRRKPVDCGSDLFVLPWRYWAYGGGAAILLAWIVDRTPGLFESSAWQADFVHPLYAISWIACGEILVFLESRAGPVSRYRKAIVLLSGFIIASLVYTMFFLGPEGKWGIDPIANQLTRLKVDPGVSSLVSLVKQSSDYGLMLITLLPVLLLGLGIVALVKNRSSGVDTRLVAFVLGPVLMAFAYTFINLGWWSHLDALLLLLACIVFAVTGASKVVRWCVGGMVLLSSALGAGSVYSGLDQQSRESADPVEVALLLERHLAHWIALRVEEPGAVVLAPPSTSVSLAFYGGLGVIGTPYPENSDGFAAAVRICAATTPDEARAVASAREIEMIVHPTWDPFLEEYARIGTNQPENSFVALLNKWLPPRWLQPVAYRLPVVSGFEKEWVALFRTVEVQENVSAMGRLIQYFLDSGRVEIAAVAQKAFADGFPDELVTHLSAAEVAIALGDQARFGEALGSTLGMVEAGEADYLDWDLRVRLSLLLAGARQTKPAREILEQCLRETDEELLRQLPSGQLNGLLRLAKALELEFSDRDLRDFGISLLPEAQRSGL